MMYKCEKCNYETNRLLNYKRHELRKIQCNRHIIDNNVKIKVVKNVMGNPENVMGNPENVMGNPENVMGNPENVMATLQCSKCNKCFTRKDHMKTHEKKCDGTDVRQCKVCLKIFATRQSKYEHIKYVKCNSPQIINNINNITNNTDNSITNNITNNITLDFGKENLKLLFEDKDYNKNIEKCIKLGKYALQKSIDEIYFNDKFPENQTLKKERRNDKLVSIKYSGKWETRMFEDIYKDVMKITEKYHNKYMKELQTKYIDIERDIPFNKLMYPLRCFGHQMLWYGWTCNEIRNLGIELNDPDDDDELHRRIKAIKTVLLEKIYMKSLGTLGTHTCGSPCGSPCGSIPANCHVVY
jgi:hypothetical protein